MKSESFVVPVCVAFAPRIAFHPFAFQMKYHSENPNGGSMKFWLVWNPNGSNPQHRHSDYSSAEAEAKRLALANPTAEFYVIEARARVKHEAVRVEPLTVHDDTFVKGGYIR